MTILEGRNRTYLLVALLVLAALLAVGWAAWVGAQEATPESETAPTVVYTQMGMPDSDGNSAVPYEGPSGIWVTGQGKASGAPDIAVISLGVESVEDTAAEARANAATAMNGVLDALKEEGIAEADIQTRYFRISPRYQSVEVQRCDEPEEASTDSEQGQTEQSLPSKQTCYNVWESRLIGYSVSNQASVTIRSLDNVGTIIDEASEAAGDLVRINGISFNIDDPQSLQDEARENAVSDMKRRAEMLADLSGVKLGRLVYITEGGSLSPPQPYLARAEAAFADSAATTSISPGELDISTTVQGVFLIAGEAE